MYNIQDQSIRYSAGFALGTNEEDRSHRQITHQWNRTPGSLAGTNFTHGIYDPTTRRYSDLYESFSAPRQEANRARSITNRMMSRDSAFDFDEFDQRNHPLNRKKSSNLSKQLERIKAGASLEISTRGVDLESTISYLAESLPFEVGIAEYQGHATITRGSGTSTRYKFLKKEKLLATYHSHPKSGVAGFGRQDLKSYLERLKKYGDFENYVAGSNGVVATLRPDDSGSAEKLSSKEIDYLSNSLFAVETSRSMGGVGKTKLEQAYKNIGLIRGQDYLQNVSSSVAKGLPFEDKKQYLDGDRDEFVDPSTRHIQHESNIVGMLTAGGIWGHTFYKGFNNKELDFSDSIFAGIANTTKHTQKISLGATGASLAWSILRGRSWEDRLQGGSLALAAGLGDIAGRQITEKVLLKSPVVQEFLGRAAGVGADIFGKSSSKFFTKTSNDWRLASEELLSGKPSQAVLRSIGNLGMEVIGFPIELFFIAPIIGGVLGRIGRAMDEHSVQSHKNIEEKQKETQAAIQQQSKTITSFIPADKINPVGSLNVKVNRKDHPINLSLIDNALENQINTGLAYTN